MSFFHKCFQPAMSSCFQCVEWVWSILKKAYLVRLHRRETDLKDHAELEAMIVQLYQEVPICTENILRANRSYIEHYLALGEEQSLAAASSPSSEP